MSIASEKVKLATERFLLVRLNPARYILPTLNGGVYELLSSVVANRIDRNGASLSKVDGVPSVNDTWSQDETTGLIQVKLASPPNDTTNILIAYYYLYYTGTIYRLVTEDPEDDSTSIRQWQPKIDRYPTVVQSFSNLLAGVFTISDTSVSIINEDGSFQDYLTDNDSFYNKQVDMWMCINSAANIQKIFTGTIQAVSLGQNTVSFRCVDSFNALNQPAFLGDEADESYFRRNLSSFPNLDPKAHEKPCPYIVGSSSRFQTILYSVGLVGAPDVFRIGVGTEGFCTSFSATVSTSTNRTWGACRIKGSVATQSFGAIQAELDTGTGFRFVRFASVSNVQVGDTIKWVEAATTYYGIVNYVGAFTYLAVNYNIVISDPEGPFTTSSVVSNLKSFSVFIDAPTGERVYAKYLRDYTVTETTTSGNNKYLSIVFVNNFEASHAVFSGDALDPQRYLVYYRTSNSTVQKHGDIIEEMLGKVGLVADSTSFTAINTDLPVNARFHIPNFDEFDYKTYLEYCQDVLASTLGYLKINSSFEVEYHLLSAPSSSSVRDSFLTLEGGTSCEVEYADIATTIIAFNPHNDSQLAIDGASSPSETRENTKSRYLNGVVNVDRFRHVLEEITSKIDDHIGLKSMRRAVYTFSTATEDIDSELGDDLQLENKIVLGGSEMADVKIITIDKSPGRIAIEASDLKGL